MIVVATSMTPSAILTSVHTTLVNLNWRAAMEEYGALMSNGIWELVPRPRGSNVVTSKWIFTHKFLSDVTLNCYKAHWVLWGFTHHPRGGLRQDFQPGCKTSNCPDGARYCCILRLDDSVARCEECIPPRDP
jgi:hypothetical protein